MRIERRDEETVSGFPFVISFVIYLVSLLFGLPLGLKIFGPWAHHTECVIDVKKKKKVTPRYEGSCIYIYIDQVVDDS